MKKQFEAMKNKAGAGVHYEKTENGAYEVFVGNRVIGTMQKKSNDIWRGRILHTGLSGSAQAVEMIDCLDDMIDRYVNIKKAL